MPLRITTEPASEPLSLADARLHLRIDAMGSPPAHPEDDRISALISAARMVVERELNGRVLLTQQWELTRDMFPSTSLLQLEPLDICMAPITSMDSVKYIDTAGAQQTWDPTKYRVDLYSTPARITPEFGQIYPITRAVMNTIAVAFTVGYANAGAVPQAIKQAMLLLIGEWFEYREEELAGLSKGPLSFGVSALLARYRLQIP